MFYLHLIHYIGFVSAQILNFILAFLIVTRAKHLFGTYRHVMLVFAVCSMLLSWVEILTQPVLHMKGSMFVVFVDHTYLPTAIRDRLPALHCGTFGLLVVVLVAQFFYRYIALCKTEFLNHFNGPRIFFIFAPCVFIYIAWYNVVEWGMGATLEKREYLRDDLAKLYNTDSMSAPFIAPLYWSIGVDNEKVWRLADVISTMIVIFMITMFSSLIVFFALKIYFYMATAKLHMSARSLELNRQLFRMLLVQTIVPFVFMYIPVGLFITLPFFELSMGKYSNLSSISITVYPMVEPLIAMYCITDFRNTIKKFFLCSFKTTSVSDITSHQNCDQVA